LVFSGGLEDFSCYHVFNLEAERFGDLDVGFVGGGWFRLKVA
jgi:hypothetical protein